MFEKVSWDAIGQAAVGICMGLGTVGSIAYAAIMKHKARVASFGAEAARADSEKTVADSQQIVYDSLSRRVEAMDADIRQLREELAAERRHSRRLELLNRKLELHILRLEALMRAAGIDVPAIVEVEHKEGDGQGDNE